jgi:hypothetical protein
VIATTWPFSDRRVFAIARVPPRGVTPAKYRVRPGRALLAG